MPNNPLPTQHGDTQATASSFLSKGDSLIPTLSRLSQSTSRPSISGNSDTSDQGITRQTMKLGKEAWRRSGLGSLWSSNDKNEFDASKVRSKNDEARRQSMESTSTTASSSTYNKLRSQPLDTSSILYPTLTIHPPPVQHNVLVLSLAHVSLAPPTLSNDELFSILLRRLEPWVGEEAEGGYVLVVLAAEDSLASPGSGLNGKGKEKERRKLPGIGWWVWRWKRLPRKYRKNLKRLYIVHPSMFTRTLLPFIAPFISPKSYSKLHPLPTLLSLHHTYGVSLRGIDISPSVLSTESRILKERPDLLPPLSIKRDDRQASGSVPALKRMDSESSLASWGYHTISSAVETAASYLPLPLPQFGASSPSQCDPLSKVAAGHWNRNLDELIAECGGNIPPLLVQLRKVILRECLGTEGVFRRSSNSPLLPATISLLDIPIDQQPNLPWNELAREDPLLPPKILSRFLKELDEPVIQHGLYGVIKQVKSVDDIRTMFIPSLPRPTYQILAYTTHLMHHLSLHADRTKMTPLNLSIVISPVLISGPDPIEDTILCLEPSKPLPVGLKAMAGDKYEQGQGTLVGLLDMWITHYEDLEIKEDGLVREGGKTHSLLSSGTHTGGHQSMAATPM
ncbi:uncharacterized protein I303_100505 [Kwoniella dejecticola CBS 10117]|uniref:Rho-GAP domain-containing protein n=1 Tax=Kwoniella dejecticola CBS 10117 TaxID=1296121 RepID=A0A1A6AF84_9TREE|nr:uncharacterized protein I303_00505 [Kwoniella dejecticola CBS 10117]OBR88688.1 hypothetical protein I303_00505 [Kwoniella dejecticola CBS 10117]